jgi:hypothetical protein
MALALMRLNLCPNDWQYGVASVRSTKGIPHVRPIAFDGHGALYHLTTATSGVVQQLPAKSPLGLRAHKTSFRQRDDRRTWAAVPILQKQNGDTHEDARHTDPRAKAFSNAS